MKWLALAAAAAVSLSATSRQTPSMAREHATSGVFNRALGVECSHCHVAEQWSAADKKPFQTARNMIAMVAEINRALEPRDGIGCITCHGGQTRPERQPRPLMDEQLAKWPAELASAPEGVKATMAVYNVALGVECSHCHVADWKSSEKPAMKTVATMNALFEIFPRFMPPGTRTQCYMCHKGSPKPVRP